MLQSDERLARCNLLGGSDPDRRQVGRPLLGEPLEGFVVRRVEEQAAALEEQHAIAALERERRTLLRHDDGSS
jgi:hypothetical protein